MAKKYTKSKIFVLAVLILSVILVSKVPAIMGQNSISTTGRYTVSIEPELVRVRIGYENEATTAGAAEEENAKVMNRVKSALTVADVDDIKTTSYNVRPEYEWRAGNRELIRYTAIHYLEIETDDMDNIGKYIDIAFNSGANRVDSIQFDISDITRNKMKAEALTKAAEDSRNQADAIAEGLGKRVYSVISVSDRNFYANPYRYSYSDVVATSVMEGARSFADTDISPGDLDISAQVNVRFGII